MSIQLSVRNEACDGVNSGILQLNTVPEHHLPGGFGQFAVVLVGISSLQSLVQRLDRAKARSDAPYFTGIFDLVP